MARSRRSRRAHHRGLYIAHIVPSQSTPDVLAANPPSPDQDVMDIDTEANEHVEKGPTTDYGSTMVQWMKHRRRGRTKIELERPSPSYIIDMLPPAARLMNPADTIPAKHLHSSLNKIKHPVNVVRWTPEGRRLLTGSTSGEFTLWNGMGFNFETIMSAHESAIRGAIWSHSGDWLVSADQDGILKYWQPNFNMVNSFVGHEACIRDLSFSPSDSKFVTASDDTTLKIWDFSRGVADSTLTGHGWDAKSVDWHPTKGLLVSGSKDHQVKLWDPRTSRCLTTLHGHKNTITKTLFEPRKGLLLATAARDQTARIFDLRMMRDVVLLRGHEKDIMTLTWHPVHASLLSTGSYDGSLHHYLLDEPNDPPGTAPTLSVYDSPDPAAAPAQTIFPAHRVSHAHESAIWSLDWHPLGHILASGSNDRITRFWTRPRPGEFDCYKDRYHLGDAAAEAHGTWSRSRGRQQARDEEEQEAEDEADGLVDQKLPTRQGAQFQPPGLLPGLPGIVMTRDGTSTGGAQMQLPGMGGAVQPPPMLLPTNMPMTGFNPTPLPGAPPPSSMDPDQISQLAKLFGGQMPLPLPIPGYPPLPPGMLPPGFAPISGFGAAQGQLQPQQGTDGGDNEEWQYGGSGGGPAHGNGIMTAAPGADGYGGGGGMRRRAPLPSQQDSMREEMRRGGYRQGR